MKNLSFLGKKNIIRSIATILASLLICLGVFTSRQINSIFYSSQDLLVILCAACLGGLSGAGATGIYILLGCLNLRVFPGFAGGFNAISSQNAGFIWGYFIGAIITGLFAGNPSEYEKKFSIKKMLFLAAGIFLGFLIIDTTGLFWFCYSSEIDFFGNFKESVLKFIKPFILDKTVKFFLVVSISLILRPVIAKLLYPAADTEREASELLEKLKKTQENKNRKKTQK